MVEEEKINDDEDDTYWFKTVSNNIRRLDWKIHQGEIFYMNSFGLFL